MDVDVVKTFKYFENLDLIACHSDLLVSKVDKLRVFNLFAFDNSLSDTVMEFNLAASLPFSLSELSLEVLFP